MKRDCLLSKAYAAPPMTFNGTPIHYCALVNEIVRGLGTPVFSSAGNGTMTQNMGFVECIYIMQLLASGKKQDIAAHCELAEAERNTALLKFYLANEDEIERLKPEIVARLEAAAASSVESDGPGGKPLEPAPASSP